MGRVWLRIIPTGLLIGKNPDPWGLAEAGLEVSNPHPPTRKPVKTQNTLTPTLKCPHHGPHSHTHAPHAKPPTHAPHTTPRATRTHPTRVTTHQNQAPSPTRLLSLFFSSPDLSPHLLALAPPAAADALLLLRRQLPRLQHLSRRTPLMRRRPPCMRSRACIGPPPALMRPTPASGCRRHIAAPRLLRRRR